MAEHNGEFRPTANTSPVGTSTVTQASVTEIEYRIEHDTMGEVRVPKDAKYQAQTQRAVENFPISFRTLEQTQIRALALIKSAAAKVNARLGVIDQGIADAIAASANRIADGEFYGDFPLDVFQTGSGTSSNMNANEVIATLAAESLGKPGAPQRSCQRLAVVERRVPDLDPRRGHRVHRPESAARAGAPRRRRWRRSRSNGPPSSSPAAPT